MKSFISTLVLGLSLTVSASAQTATSVNALQKLSNVVNNSLPSQYRSQLNNKIILVQTAMDQLADSLRGLDNVANNNLPAEYRAQVTQQIANLKSAIAQELSGNSQQTNTTSSGLYCAKACSDAFGSVMMQSAVGVHGIGELQTKQAATDALTRTHSCTFGLIDIGCESSSANPQAVVCQAACKDAWGEVVTSQTALGSGGSETEALLNAFGKVSQKYNCTFDPVKVACEKQK